MYWGEKMLDKIYAFDLDGTITKEEILPLMAQELNLVDEMKLLTNLTLSGQINFEQSFRLRYHILKSVPLKKIHQIVQKVVLDKSIAEFITTQPEKCAIVTGNLDLWIQPIVNRLGCRAFASKGSMDGSVVILEEILNKSKAIRALKEQAGKVIAIGESFNDVPMFEEADVSISFGGVHYPVDTAVSVSDYVIFEGETLCRVLKML